MADGTPTLVSFLEGFTFTNNSGYNIAGDSAAGANGIYFDHATPNVSSTFTANADGSDLGSFDLTAMSFTNYATTRNYDFTFGERARARALRHRTSGGTTPQLHKKDGKNGKNRYQS